MYKILALLSKYCKTGVSIICNFTTLRKPFQKKNALILRSLYSLDVKKKNYNKHFTFGG